MRRKFEGKTVLITGALRRLGLETAKAFIKEGANVLCHYFSSFHEYEHVEKLAYENKVKSWAIQADLSKEGEAERLVEQAYVTSPQIDVLINNASVYEKDSVKSFQVSTLLDSLWVHGISPLLLSRAFEKNATKATSIINILDGALNKHRADYFSYEMGKNMLAQATQILAIEFAPKVRVNALALGTFLPDVHGSKESYLKMIESMPIPREGTLDELSSSLFYLASNEFVTGTVLYLDGGWHQKGSQLIY